MINLVKAAQQKSTLCQFDAFWSHGNGNIKFLICYKTKQGNDV